MAPLAGSESQGQHHGNQSALFHGEHLRQAAGPRQAVTSHFGETDLVRSEVVADRLARSASKNVLFVDSSVADRIDHLEIPFNRDGLDPYGISKKHLAIAMSAAGLLYHRYSHVKVHGIENIPARGRAMLVGNHSGGVALDALMVITSAFFDMNPPRLAQGMIEKFINRVPLASLWASRTGQFTGIPEHAIRLLEDDRLVLVFPEGARGTAKLFKERYSLVDFGTGFIRLALKTQTPIIPFGFLGGGRAIPTVTNLYKVGRLLGVPYIPVTPYLLPIPLPVPLEIHYGAPMLFKGTGSEDDEVAESFVAQVKSRIAELIETGRTTRRQKAASEAGS
jgi:1-acyl-sn-glycerol-3-phosphate acyltransferase